VREGTGDVYSLRRSLVLLACLLASLYGASTSAQCEPPHYWSGRDFTNLATGQGSIFIGIHRDDLSISNMLCLVQTMKASHPKWKSSGILIFDSEKAAKYFLVPGNFQVPGWEDDTETAEWAKHLHALYIFDADKHEEYLEILPLGYGTGTSFHTRIDLPVARIPHCRFEINERCVFAMDRMDYPINALNDAVSGTIVVTGTISRDGKIRHAEIAEASAKPSEKGKLLTKAVLKNIKTCRLEKAERQDSFRMTYLYTIASPLPPDTVDVELVSPSQITITTKSQD
jgi:hypothetical protein